MRPGRPPPAKTGRAGRWRFLHRGVRAWESRSIRTTPATRTPSDDGIREAAARLAADVCRVFDIARCSVFLREPGEEEFAGVAVHPPELEHDVLLLRIGGEADAITQAIVSGGGPVFVPDTEKDPRTAQSAVRRWHVHTLLGLPLKHGDEVIGVAIVDNAERPYPHRPEHIAAAAALADAAGAAIGRAREARQLRARLQTVSRQNQLLRDASTADHRLAQIVMSGGGLGAIIAAVAELTGKPAALYDRDHRVVISSPAPGDAGATTVQLLDTAERRAAALPEMAALRPGACQPVGPLLSAGMRHRHLVAPVDLGTTRWGHVVVMEHRSRLTSFDEYTTRRAAAHVALELAAQERATTGAFDARASLAHGLLHAGEDPYHLRRSADYLGVPLDTPRVVVLVQRRDEQDETPVDAEAIAASLRAALGTDVLPSVGAEGAALLVEVDGELPPPAAVAAVRSAVREALRIAAGRTGEGALVAGLSSRCRTASEAPEGLREAREVLRCVERFSPPAGDGILAADDLGPARLFLAHADPEALDRFVADTIGPLLDGGEGTADLLLTLQAFFDTGRSVRKSAARLGVHENTVRLRLERVRTLAGVDVAADATAQLSAQVALLVARLRGHAALPPLTG